MSPRTEIKLLYAAVALAVIGIGFVSAPIYETITWQFLYGMAMVMAPIGALIGVTLLATLLERRIITSEKTNLKDVADPAVARKNIGDELASIG